MNVVVWNFVAIFKKSYVLCITMLEKKIKIIGLDILIFRGKLEDTFGILFKGFIFFVI